MLVELENFQKEIKEAIYILDEDEQYIGRDFKEYIKHLEELEDAGQLEEIDEIDEIDESVKFIRKWISENTEIDKVILDLRDTIFKNLKNMDLVKKLEKIKKYITFENDGYTDLTDYIESLKKAVELLSEMQNDECISENAE